MYTQYLGWVGILGNRLEEEWEQFGPFVGEIIYGNGVESFGHEIPNGFVRFG